MKLLSVLFTVLATLSNTKTYGSEVGTGWQDLACEVRGGMKIRTVGWWIWCIEHAASAQVSVLGHLLRLGGGLGGVRAAGRLAGPHRQPAGAELSAQVSSALMDLGDDDDEDLRAGHQQNLNDWYWTDGKNHLLSMLLPSISVVPAHVADTPGVFIHASDNNEVTWFSPKWIYSDGDSMALGIRSRTLHDQENGGWKDFSSSHRNRYICEAYMWIFFVFKALLNNYNLNSENVHKIVQNNGLPISISWHCLVSSLNLAHRWSLKMETSGYELIGNITVVHKQMFRQ